MKVIPTGISTQEDAIVAIHESLRRKNECIERCEQMIAEMRTSLRAITS